MRDADFAWLVDKGSKEVLAHAGKWVAVRNGQVIGVGETAPEAAKAACQNAGVKAGDYLLEAIDDEADVIYGPA